MQNKAQKFVLLGLLALIGMLGRSVRADDDPTPTPNQSPNANDDANKNIVLPTQPGDHKLKFRTHIGDRAVVLSYLLHLPPDYGDPKKKHPMLVFFHGIGECGTDLGGVYALGPMTLIKQDGGNPTFAASCPFIVLCPQCPPRGETWDTDFIYKAAAQLVDQTIKKTRTDADRVYATGLSMGGLGSWCVAEESPDLFAAIAPLSAMEWHHEDALEKLRYISVWAVVGDQDQPRFVDGTRAMQDALAKGPLAQRFTYYVGMGHEAWFPPYQNPQFYEWLLGHHRPNAAERKKIDAGTVPPTTQPLPATPGHYLLSFETKLGDQPTSLDYVLYLPKNYKPTGPASPAMMFLHEQDTIGPAYKDICVHGPDLALEKKPALQANFPFVIVSPRLPIKCDWETPGMTQMLTDLLDQVSQSINIDKDRISISGMNAGASGAWKLAAESPNRFSAIIPVLADGELIPGDDRRKVITSLPGRVFIKESAGPSIDRINNLMTDHSLVDELATGTKQDWHLNKLAQNANALGDLPVYSDRQLLNWLLQQKRKAAGRS
jgi:predicted peptidase